MAAEQSMMTASYDAGPQASNVTDAANQMPGLFGMRAPMPGRVVGGAVCVMCGC